MLVVACARTGRFSQRASFGEQLVQLRAQWTIDEGAGPPAMQALRLDLDARVCGLVAEGVHRVFAARHLVDVLFEQLPEENDALVRHAEPLQLAPRDAALRPPGHRVLTRRRVQ